MAETRDAADDVAPDAGDERTQHALYLARQVVQWAPLRLAKHEKKLEHLAADPAWHPRSRALEEPAEDGAVAKLLAAVPALKLLGPVVRDLLSVGLVVFTSLVAIQQYVTDFLFVDYNVLALALAATGLGAIYLPTQYTRSSQVSLMTLLKSADERLAVLKAANVSMHAYSLRMYALTLLALGGGGFLYVSGLSAHEIAAESDAFLLKDGLKSGIVRYEVTPKGDQCEVTMYWDASKLKPAEGWKCFEVPSVRQPARFNFSVSLAQLPIEPTVSHPHGWQHDSAGRFSLIKELSINEPLRPLTVLLSVTPDPDGPKCDAKSVGNYKTTFDVTLKTRCGDPDNDLLLKVDNVVVRRKTPEPKPAGGS